MVKERKETKNGLPPAGLIQDHWTTWLNAADDIYNAQHGEPSELKSYRPEDFKKSVSEKSYGARLDEVPEIFIHQLDRLRRIYDELASQKKPDLDKLERTVDLARVICYKDWGAEGYWNWQEEM